MPRLRIFRSPLTNIHTNLAIEEWLFRTLPLPQGDMQGMMLWRNTPSIDMGRNQNPWLECNVQELQRQGVELCRRVSGGGTVYHDLSNLCVTFFSPNFSPRSKDDTPFEQQFRKEVNEQVPPPPC